MRVAVRKLWLEVVVWELLCESRGPGFVVLELQLRSHGVGVAESELRFGSLV